MSARHQAVMTASRLTNNHSPSTPQNNLALLNKHPLQTPTNPAQDSHARAAPRTVECLLLVLSWVRAGGLGARGTLHLVQNIVQLRHDCFAAGCCRDARIGARQRVSPKSRDKATPDTRGKHAARRTWHVPKIGTTMQIKCCVAQRGNAPASA